MQDLSAVGQALCCNWPISFLLRTVAVCAELSGPPSPSNQPHSLQTEQEAHCRRSGSLLGRKPAPGGEMRLVCRQLWVVATRSWCCIAPNVLPHLITSNPLSSHCLVYLQWNCGGIYLHVGWAFVVSFPDALFQCGLCVLNREGVVFKCKSHILLTVPKMAVLRACCVWHGGVVS